MKYSWKPGDSHHLLIFRQLNLLSFWIGLWSFYMSIENLLDFIWIHVNLHSKQIKASLSEVVLLHVQPLMIIKDELPIILENRNSIIESLSVKSCRLSIEMAMSL